MTNSNSGVTYRTTLQESDRLPPGIPYIIGNEIAECFSFYGMKAILAVFMTKYLTWVPFSPIGCWESIARSSRSPSSTAWAIWR